MKNELNVEKSLLLELEEAEKVNMKGQDEVTYTVTYDFGGIYSIICC